MSRGFVHTIERLAGRSVRHRNRCRSIGAFWSGFRVEHFVSWCSSSPPCGLFLREFRLLLRMRHFKPAAAPWFAAIGLATAERSSASAAALRRCIRSSRRFLHA